MLVSSKHINPLDREEFRAFHWMIGALLCKLQIAWEWLWS
jgi:hypothetical protein